MSLTVIRYLKLTLILLLCVKWTICREPLISSYFSYLIKYDYFYAIKYCSAVKRMPALNRVQTERVITYFLLHNIEPIIKLFVLFFFFLFLFLLVINIVIISIIIIILCIVSGATMRNVFQSGFWCRKMAAGECGRSSRSVLGLVVEASNNPFVCVTIQSEL